MSKNYGGKGFNPGDEGHRDYFRGSPDGGKGDVYGERSGQQHYYSPPLPTEQRIRKVRAWLENNDPTIHFITNKQWYDCNFWMEAAQKEPLRLQKTPINKGKITGTELTYKNAKGEVTLVNLSDPEQWFWPPL